MVIGLYVAMLFSAVKLSCLIFCAVSLYAWCVGACVRASVRVCVCWVVSCRVFFNGRVFYIDFCERVLLSVLFNMIEGQQQSLL